MLEHEANKVFGIVKRRAEIALKILCGVLSVCWIVLFFCVALKRLHYPFELEWLESGVLISVQRVAQHLSLYARPSLDYIPFMYAPGYFYVSAWFTHLFGVSFAALRAVSALSTFASFAVLYLFVYFETRRHLPSLLAAGFYAALYGAVGAWFDLGRPDSLVVFLMLLALLLSRRRHAMLAGLIWAVAFQTKQGILPVAVLTLCWEWRQPRKILEGLGVFAVSVAGSILYFNHISDGWYGFYIFKLPGGLAFNLRQAIFFIPSDYFAIMPILLLMIMFAGIYTVRSARNNPGLDFYAVTTAAITLTVFWIRAHDGSSINSNLPLYAWYAILFGIAVTRLETRYSTRSARAILWVAVLMQLVMHLYHPGVFVTSPEVTAQREGFQAALTAIPGDVFVIDHAWNAARAGKQLHAEGVPIQNLMQTKQEAVKQEVKGELQAALVRHAYSAVAGDNGMDTYDWLPKQFDALYPVRCKLPAAPQRSDIDPQPHWVAFASPIEGEKFCSAIQQRKAAE